MARLRERRDEIEQSVLTRVYRVADPGAVGDPDYVAGLREAVSAALDYALTCMEVGEERVGPVPPALLTQARQAARNGVSLDKVLRRYFAGYVLLGDFAMRQAVAEDAPIDVRPLVKDQAALFDRVIDAVGIEYERERAIRESTRERNAERIRRLLDGEMVDAGQFEYDFSAWHVGILVEGPSADELAHLLAVKTDRRLMAVPDGDDRLWAWLGGRRLSQIAMARLEEIDLPDRTVLSVGEPAKGIAGWRRTHLQARAAFPVARRLSARRARYADVVLLTSVLQDELAAKSLRELYLAPLAGERDGGETLRETLRAFIAAERNVSSAAAALGIKRHTVTSRLRAVEQLLGRSVSSCGAEVELALRLEELEIGAS